MNARRVTPGHVLLTVTVALLMVAGPAQAAYTPTPPEASALLATDVAVVEGTHVTTASFDRTMQIATFQYGKTPNAKELASLRKQILEMLIDRARYALEAAQRGVVVTDEDVRKRFLPLKRETFSTERDYQRFLANTGQTEQDLLDLVRATLTRERIQKMWAGDPTVTSTEMKREYRKHRRRYVRPATRDLRIIFTASAAKARAARAALASGMSFKAVARKYSQDQETKRRGGRFPGVERGQFEPRLDRAVFRANRGEIVGPVKTQFGYYVFVVTRIYERRQLTFSQARRKVKSNLLDRKRDANINAALKDFESRWRPATLCRASLAIDACGLTAP